MKKLVRTGAALIIWLMIMATPVHADNCGSLSDCFPVIAVAILALLGLALAIALPIILEGLIFRYGLGLLGRAAFIAMRSNRVLRTAARVGQAFRRNPYRVAARGGRNSGMLKNYGNKSPKELQKAVSSFEKQIQDHLNKISDPKTHFKDYDKVSKEALEHLLGKKWPKDILRQEEQMSIIKEILKLLGS